MRNRRTEASIVVVFEKSSEVKGDRSYADAQPLRPKLVLRDGPYVCWWSGIGNWERRRRATCTSDVLYITIMYEHEMCGDDEGEDGGNDSGIEMMPSKCSSFQDTYAPVMQELSVA